MPQSADWDEAWLAGRAEDDEYPGDPEDYEDPDNAPPPGLDDDQLAAMIARVADPGALKAAIGRAVMEVNPGKAKQRREHMARRTRVERWAEDSGNAGLAGRELPRPKSSRPTSA